MAFRLNYQSAALRVCVDEAGGGKFQGRVVSQRLSAPMVFHDVDFFTQIDAILNEQKYPQAFQRVRTFSEKRSLEVPVALSEEEMSDPESVDCADGRVTTFLMK